MDVTMKIYVTVYWCDGFGNDSFVGGIYSSLEKAMNSINDEYRNYSPHHIRIVKTYVDEEMDFDFYELLYTFDEVYDCFGRRLSKEEED